MLSATELYKYRQGHDATIPQKGGQKEFLPDGSWLQNKQIENFHQERQHVLNEPRVLRNDIVKGSWNPEKKLVELKNESKNFWETMGFNDDKRKWLYPEEALYLLETTVLMVEYQSLPMSIQEAYMVMLDDVVTPDYYQVYAHLRRQGYIVVRHQGRINITEYERKVGLDKYKRKEKKGSKRKIEDEHGYEADSTQSKKSTDIEEEDKNGNDQSLNDATKKPAGFTEDAVSNEDDDFINRASFKNDTPITEDEESDKNRYALNKANFETNTSVSEDVVSNDTQDAKDEHIFEKKTSFIEDVVGTKNSTTLCKINENKFDKEITTTNLPVHTVPSENDSLDDHVQEGEVKIEEESEDMSVCEASMDTDVGCKSEKNKLHTADLVRAPLVDVSAVNNADKKGEKIESKEIKKDGDKFVFQPSNWDFSKIVFPNFSSSHESITFVSSNNSNFFPGQFQLDSLEYTFEKDKFINTKKVKFGESVDQMEFSFDKNRVWQQQKQVKCSNWKEYKQSMKRVTDSWDRRSELPHLYAGEVTPLVLPEYAHSTAAVLDRLSVIPDGVKQVTKSRLDHPLMMLKPQFDVYGPNTKFKKCNPGVPDSRIIITRFDAELPSLQSCVELRQSLADSADLLWAVLGGGNIAFYSFADFVLPRDISVP